jgi:DNA-binding NarL/FixJ family response regulator
MTPSRPYTVSIVEDSIPFAKRMRAILHKASDFAFGDHFETAEQALQFLPSRKPDLLLVDLDLPGLHGSECIKRLRSDSTFDSMRIVVLTIFEDEELILRCLRSGANGYLLKDVSAELLLAELRVAVLGGAAMTQSVAARITRLQGETPAVPNPLTDRETQVINLISLGITYAEVAEELKVSLHTVRSHIENIYAKLNVHSKSAALKKSRELGVVPPR